MLVNLEQEVRDILITIGHSFESFDFVVNSFGDGRSDSPLEIIQDKMSFAEILHCQFPKGRNI